MQTAITIPKNFMHGDDLMLVRRKEYESIKKQLEETRHALRVISQGDKEYRQGKLKPVKSISELLK